MTHPYLDLADTSFWSRTMTWASPGQVDPIVPSTAISPNARIATIGSCFAQNMSRYLEAAGLHYYVAEPAPPTLDAVTARAKGYGLYSARYGNVYTPRQALQLFDRAFDLFAPKDGVWTRENRFVDAFRPTVEPEGFASSAEVEAETRKHLRCVREMFLHCDWLIFTLGLTECWCSCRDGAVYPIAPGVRGGTFDAAEHDFVNLSIDDTRRDLTALIEKLQAVNSAAKIMLTVSPVPLVATYEPRHVLTSTVASKSILRSAADEMERRVPQVTYFPAYEIVTSPAAGGRYYEDDLRSINELGINHVMRVFRKHFTSTKARTRPALRVGAPTPLPADADLVCDETWLDQAREAAFGSAG